MRRLFLILYFTGMSLSLMGWTQPQQTRTIRVGVYENAPKIYTAEDGTVSGFWPELIQDIAQEEGWKIVWVHGTWVDCLSKLEINEIDIMPDVAWSEARSQIYAFNDETALVGWTTLYVPRGSKIETILDLEGKTIAGLAGSVNLNGPDGIKDLTTKFGIHSTFIEKSSYPQVFQALQNKKVDAGITNNFYGNLNEQNYDVVRTPIIFQPSDIRFAFTKDAQLTPYLIETIDARLKALKADPGSVYYQALDQYLGDKTAKTFIEIIPPWVNTLVLSGGGMILFLLAVSFISRRQARRQTAELRASEFRNRALLENIPDLIFRISREGVFLDYHAAAEDRLYVPPEEFLGRNVGDVLPPELAQATLDRAKQSHPKRRNSNI